MFRPRRATLVQRLWRHRCVTPGPEDAHAPLKPAAHALFKKLREPELEVLLRAVEGQGRAGESACVWVEARGFRPGLPATLLLCRLYRWPDLGHPHELKRLSFCKSAGGEGSAHCCNPHHLSRLVVPETPPPAYGKISPSILPLKSPTAFDRNRKPWQDTTLSRQSLKDGYWCKLAYWEYRLRVGRLYPVHEDYIHVFCDAPAGSGFCLAQLGSRSPSPAVRRARAKIGQGLLISREGPGVWVYNRSDHPCFVSSPTLGPSVHKVLPGYAIKVYDEQRAGYPVVGAGWPGQNEGPCDAHAVRISFGKGWGPCYSRRFITSCPCWMEILMNTPR